MAEPQNLFEKSEKPNEFFLLTDLFARKLAFPIAWLLHKLGVGANAVTVVSGYAWVASVPLIVLAGLRMAAGRDASGWTLALTAAFLWTLGYVLDVVDGSLARMNSTQGPAGAYLDYYFHLLFQPMFFASIGVFLFLASSSSLFLYLGLLMIAGNWPVSHAAREHTLCEQIALGRCRPASMTEAERYQHFIDTPRLKKGVGQAQRLNLMRWITRLLREALFFPGQFSFMGLVLVVDFFLRARFGNALYVTKFTFTAGAVLLIGSLPFRMVREYRRMKHFEAAIARDQATAHQEADGEK